MQANHPPKKIKLDINGILLLDKPIGVSSNFILQKVKRLFNAKKVGHTGSLDPLATGMLPICFGRATKFCQYLLATDKIYKVTMCFGEQTATGDAEGEIILTKAVPDNLAMQLKQILPSFLGTQTQIPSMYSALKYQGKPLYELARQGITVERAPRKIHIYALDLLAVNGKEVTLQVHCSKGTYIRNLVEDIAKALDSCAYVTMLRRLSVGNFQAAQMVSFEQLAETDMNREQYLISIANVFSAWPKLELSTAYIQDLRNGKNITIEQTATEGQWLSLCDEAGQFCGIVEVIAGRQIILRKGI